MPTKVNPEMKILMPKRIDHVAIIVRNIELALVFYRNTLDIMPGEIKEVPTEHMRITFLPMGGPGGSEIKLIEPTTPDSSLTKFLLLRSSLVIKYERRVRQDKEHKDAQACKSASSARYAGRTSGAQAGQELSRAR